MTDPVFVDGWHAALEGNYDCPYPIWSLRFWSWEAGNWAGHHYVVSLVEHCQNMESF